MSDNVKIESATYQASSLATSSPFLPTKDAVSTSILSTRWKQLWKLVTILDIDDYNTCISLKTKFTSFVYRALGQCGVSCLHKFCLRCSQRYDFSHGNAWVAAILTHSIQELDLSIILADSPGGHALPRDLFSCSTLVVLKLDIEFGFNIPTSVCLPRLKTLHLNSVIFLDAGDSFKRLILGCPVLDELSLSNCAGLSKFVMHIFAPLLTDLRLLNNHIFGYKLVIDTPALRYLKLIEHSAEVYLVSTNLCHLIEAEIGIAKQPNHNAITDLLTGISNVQQWLYLRRGCLMAIQGHGSQLPIFHNLTSLVLGENVGWELMSQLLEKLPHLEILVFTEPYLHFRNDDNRFRWHPPQNVPSCLHFNLKVIKIRNFQANDEELKVVEYFLKNAEVLEKVIIHCHCLVPEKMEVTKKLLMLPRGSSTCNVELL